MYFIYYQQTYSSLMSKHEYAQIYSCVWVLLNLNLEMMLDIYDADLQSH